MDFTSLHFASMPLGDQTFLFTPEGGLMAFGYNTQGQLGVGHLDSQRVPVEVGLDGAHPVQTSWGVYHSLVLDSEGCVWETGCTRVDDKFLTFQRVPELSSIVMVAAGREHSAAIDSQGALWLWTGESDVDWASSIPKCIEGVPPLVKVASGEGVIVGEGADGSLWGFGNNSRGQLGLGHTEHVPQPTRLTVPGLPVGPLRGLTACSHSILLIDSLGTIWTSGDNRDGELGRVADSDKLEPIVNVPPMLEASCGCSHTLALDESGGVWSWGYNDRGQLGTGDTANRTVPFCVDSLKGATTLLAGGSHSLVFHPDGLMVFGHNDFGQLGINYTLKQVLPTPCPLQALPKVVQSRQKSAISMMP